MSQNRNTRGQGGVAGGILRSMRPHQWVKNLLVVAPLFFAQAFDQWITVLQSLGAAAGFCLMASAVYMINDLVDRERDQRHPVKKHRPIASGRVSPALALRVAAGLGLMSALIGALIHPLVAVLLLSYLLLNLAYSGWLKRVPFVDVTVIAVGFVLRVVAGGVAIGVLLSEWLVLCTFLLAVYLGLGKRRHELALQVSGTLERTRRSLGAYRLEHVDTALVAVAGFTVAVYTIYAVTASLPDQPLRLRETPVDSAWLPVTIPLVTLGLARFFALCRSEGLQSPTEAMLKDRALLSIFALWGGVLVFLTL